MSTQAREKEKVTSLVTALPEGTGEGADGNKERDNPALVTR